MRLPRLRRRLVLPGVVGGVTALLLGAGAAAAFEADTVSSYWDGLWWALGLMTTVGFVGGPPRTTAGAVISAVLMLAGFLLLSLISAGLASLFVREDEAPFEAREQALEREVLDRLTALEARIAELDQRLQGREDREAGPQGRAPGG